MKPIKLTVNAIEKAALPDGKSQVLIPVADLRRTYLRVRRREGGKVHKTLVVAYRTNGGRAGQQRFHTIDDATCVSPKDLREAALIVLGRLARGEDPSGERKAEAKRERARLRPALDRYETALEGRQVVKRGEVLSLLRRELLGPLGNLELGELDRPGLVERVRAIEKSGRPGAAKELRTRAGVFLGWCVDEGLIAANPLAGWRQPRRTRAQRLEQPGRALDDAELPGFWRAAEAEGWPFGPYLQMLLMLGQRRTETSLMSWRDVDLEAGVWTIPAEVTKSGRVHSVPLPKAAVEILSKLPRMARTGAALVFPGRHGRPMAGWSKRLPDVYKRTAEAGMASWTPHDLRRTARTGLGRLGVEPVVCELMINHAISDDLARIYDRGEYWQQRAEAAERWAAHVLGAVDGGAKVVPMRRAR